MNRPEREVGAGWAVYQLEIPDRWTTDKQLATGRDLDLLANYSANILAKYMIGELTKPVAIGNLFAIHW